MPNTSRILKIHAKEPTEYLTCLTKNRQDPLTCGKASDLQRLEGYSSATQLLMEFLSEIKQPFEFVFTGASTGTKHLNTTSNTTYWSGALGFLHDGTVDTNRFTFTLTAERQDDFEFSFPVRFIRSGFAFKRPGYAGNANVLFHAFTFALWITLISTALLILASITVHYSMYLKDKGITFIKSITNSSWTMVSMVTGTDFEVDLRAIIERRSRFSFRNSLGCFSIFILFTLSLYQSSLLRAMLQEEKTFSSTSELARLVKTHERYLVHSSYSYLGHVNASKTYAFGQMKEALVGNQPVQIDSDMAKVAEYLSSHPEAVLVGTSALKARVIASQLCGLMHTVDLDNDALQTTAFIFRKKDPLLKALNRWIVGRGVYPMDVIKASLLQRIKLNPVTNCKQIAPGHPLKLERLIGAFYVCICGFSAAFIALNCEWLSRSNIVKGEKVKKRKLRIRPKNQPIYFS